ncbi:MAG: TonB C-terminal domain-containing protein [Planctomycetes bacterium]|nr:TonB C-terminal domain-containing protein [Planctomycetota bacterium]
MATDRPGPGIASRGQEGDRPAPVALPQALPGRDDAVAQLRARRTSNAQLSREEKTLADGQEHLEFLLNRAVAQRWRHLLPEVREHRLVIQVMVDRSGRLVEGRLLSGSGSEAFDQVVGDWLRNETLTFPPIRAGVRYPFLVIIHP